jgi:hypothetical protein
LEHKAYIKRVFLDHLLDATTYLQLQAGKAKAAVNDIFNQIDNFLVNHHKFISQEDRIFIDRSATVDDPFAYFYLTLPKSTKNFGLRELSSQLLVVSPTASVAGLTSSCNLSASCCPCTSRVPLL